LENYLDHIINMIEKMGIDPLYGITFIDLILFFIIFGKNLKRYLRKDIKGYEKLFNGYVKSQILGLAILIILCFLHFFEVF
jgi:hypothetical protein